MFMYDFHTANTVGAEVYMDESVTNEALNEAASFESLLNTVDAARTGLVSDEHDYDIVDDEAL